MTGHQHSLEIGRSGNGIITVSELSYSYNGSEQAVLQDLTLRIPAGTITAILGPNGSGKTTLLRLLLGILRPKKGSIYLAGRPQNSYSRRELSQFLGLVPQDEHIPFDFTIFEYVLMGRAPYLRPLAMPGVADQEIAQEALRMAGLEHLQDRPLPDLSGGERQLAVLARALAQRPRILLLDEPAAHLDLSNKGRLLGILRDMATEGVSLVLTTHDPNAAALVASHVVLMREGRVMDAGSTTSMLTSEKLSNTYDIPVEVVQVEDRPVVLLS